VMVLVLPPNPVQNRMGLNNPEEKERKEFLNRLLKAMISMLRDTIKHLSDILSGRVKWNANFEIFELSIRRCPPPAMHLIAILFLRFAFIPLTSLSPGIMSK